MTIRPTAKADADALLALFAEARGTIAALGIDQWQNGYPDRSVVEEDIDRGLSYAVTDSTGALIATFVLVDREPTYDRIVDGQWLTGDTRAYIAMHRVAVSVACRGTGIPDHIVRFAAEHAMAAGCRSVRIDTHEGNAVMRRMLEKRGFVWCGRIFLTDGSERVAYEKTV